MSSINSLGIKLGNTNCRLAYASITEWNSLHVNCLNGIDEQFATKTLFTVKANSAYSEGVEQCLASKNVQPSNIIFDTLNLRNYSSICYSDEDFGDVFANKKDGKYKLKICDGNENDQKQQIVEYKDIEVIAGILAKLIETAKEQLAEKVAKLQQIVITVPSISEYGYREKILKAVKILDLPSDIDVQLMAQITASAIAYRHKEGDAAHGNVLFFYMGARNTECAIYKFLDCQTPELCYADGFLDFGGENFTSQLTQKQMKELKMRNWEKWGSKMDDEEKRIVYQNVRMAMERIKAQLGCMESAIVEMDLGPTLHGRKFTITREQFEEICKDQCQRLELFFYSIFDNFNEQINRFVLVGESAKLYLVQKLFHKFCNKEKILPMNALAPELAVVRGAAIKAAYEAFGRNGNGLPKCLTKAYVPNYAFRGIYGKINENYSSNLPSIEYGQQIPTKEFQIKGDFNTILTWNEECGNENNDYYYEEIMKFNQLGYKEYFVKIDKNGLLQFKCSDGKIWCQNDWEELDECIKRFKKYESDVQRVKEEHAEWERKRKEGRRLKKQRELEEKKKKQKQKELEEKKQQEAKKEEELANKQKLDDENKKKNLTTEIKVIDIDKIGVGNSKKKFVNLAVEQASEVIAPDSDVVDVLFEYKFENKQANNVVYLRGSWDWNVKIPMKFSQFTNSFLTVLSLPISKGEYEFLFGNENNIWNFDNKYLNRINKTLGNNNLKKKRVNLITLNSNAQIYGNENSTWVRIRNKDLLEKIMIPCNSMVNLVNHLKNIDIKESSGKNVNLITRKYSEIRKALLMQFQIKSHKVKALIDETNRAYTFLKIIFFVEYDWTKIEKGSIVLKECENAKKIRIEFMNMLRSSTMSKEETIHHFRHTFCFPLLGQCRQIGLGEMSTEIKQLNAFLNDDISHPNGTPV